MMTSQHLPKVSFQPGYFSSSQSRSSGLTPATGFHHSVGRHDHSAQLLAVVVLVEVTQEDVPVPGLVEPEVLAGSARTGSTIHSCMNSLNEPSRCSSGM